MQATNPPAGSIAEGSPASGDSRWDRSFFGHPRGLSTLFFVEMWERFSYYGMRALLILFMTATAAKGGLGFNTSKAGAIYGLYTSLIYLFGLPGGWLADRIFGLRKSVLWGGIIIACGHFAMAFENLTSFYVGLGLIVVGTGMLKTNASTLVGTLYDANDERRDAGFSIYYMGINIGALVAPLVCGYLGENINWHYGFAAAGVGMTLGVIQYAFGDKYLGARVRKPSRTPEDMRIFKIAAGAFVALIGLGTLLAITGALPFTAEGISDGFGWFLLGVVIVFFAWLLNSKDFDPKEKKRFWAILVLFIASGAFWSAFEQAGSTLNLFAERNTNLHTWDFRLWGFFRASYFQSFNSVFLIIFAPIFAWLWIRMGKGQPSSTAKFSLGLIFVGLGFAILIPIANGTAVSPWWLTATYLLHTIGELCLSPVGLSAMTKLAPERIAGVIMGAWFLSISVGDYIGGRLASVYETFPLPTLFGIVAGFCILMALLLVLLIRPMRRLMGGVN